MYMVMLIETSFSFSNPDIRRVIFKWRCFCSSDEEVDFITEIIIAKSTFIILVMKLYTL